ncbi:MAG: hypothetical protein J6Y95_05455, partial [Lachnospiraceae bacterium]|nr:hypothetical protein [Lachnospiraceae bacterium]
MMKITNARLFLNNSFVPGGIEFGRTITAAGQEVNGPGDLDAEGCFLIPGLVDIHTHGAVGADTSDGDPEGLLRMARFYAAGGVTSWCPTTVTLPEPVLERAVTTVRDYVRPSDGAKIAASAFFRRRGKGEAGNEEKGRRKKQRRRDMANEKIVRRENAFDECFKR